MPWVLAAAAVTVGGSLLASNNASNAAQAQASAVQQGAAASTAEQRREFDLIQQETAPGRGIGTAAMGALGSSFGLPGYGNGVSMTGAAGGSGPSAASDPYFGYNIPHGPSGPAPAPSTAAPPSATSAPSMTGNPMAITQVEQASSGGGAPGSAVASGKSAAVDPTAETMTLGRHDPPAGPASGATPNAPPAPSGAAPPAQQVPDWDAFLQANPDVMAWAQSGHGDPNIPIDQQSMQQRAAYWMQNAQTQGDARAQQPLPMKDATPVSTGSTTPSGPAPGYVDATAPNGYTVGPRPDVGQAPAPYAAPDRTATGPAPVRMTSSPLDVSEGAYHVSPGYNFQVSQAQKQLGNLASSMGGVMSGSRVAASLQRANDLANTDYTDWRNYTTGQYNTDRARQDQVYGQDLSQYDLQQNRGDNIYNSDRAFGYGQAQDALSQYNLNRTRSDGLYADDRNYTAGRSDTRNNQLMTLAGFGNAATNTSANAAQSFATNAGNNIMTGANARGNAAINSANAWSSGINNIAQTGAYLGGQYMASNPGAMTGYSPSGYYNAADPVMGVI